MLDIARSPVGHAIYAVPLLGIALVKAQRVLQESEERFRNMADTAPVMIWVSGPDTLCTFFNKGWLIFTGRSLEEEAGNGWMDRLHPEDRERWRATSSACFDARIALQMEYRLRRADGVYRSLLCTGVFAAVYWTAASNRMVFLRVYRKLPGYQRSETRSGKGAGRTKAGKHGAFG